jgi:hypothetical protein
LLNGVNEIDQIEIDQIEIDQIEIDQIEIDQIEIDQIEIDQIEIDQIEIDQKDPLHLHRQVVLISSLKIMQLIILLLLLILCPFFCISIVDIRMLRYRHSRARVHVNGTHSPYGVAYTVGSGAS